MPSPVTDAPARLRRRGVAAVTDDVPPGQELRLPPGSLRRWFEPELRAWLERRGRKT